MKTEIKDRGARWKYFTDPTRFRCDIEEFCRLAEKERDEKQSWLGYDFGSDDGLVWWKWPIIGQESPWWGIVADKNTGDLIEIKQLQTADSYPIVGDDGRYHGDIYYDLYGLGRDDHFNVRQEAKVKNIYDFGARTDDHKITLDEVALINFTEKKGSIAVASLTLNAEKITGLTEKLRKKIELPVDVYPGQRVSCYIDKPAASQRVRLYTSEKGWDQSLSKQELAEMGISKFELEDKVEDVRLKVVVDGFPLEMTLSRELKPNWWQEIFSEHKRLIRPITKTRIRFGDRECAL